MGNKLLKRVFVSRTPHICHRCEKAVETIGVIGDTHTTLYCSICGNYIKHAPQKEAMSMVIVTKYIKDETPMKLIDVYTKSERSI